MSLLKRRPFPIADRTRDGELYRHMHPRLAALDLLKVKIADKKAGLDPYDHTVFILQARQDETVWANRALEVVGIVLSSVATDTGGRRFRAVLETEIRHALGLEGAAPPLMEDEPLASRGLAATPADAVLRVLHPNQPYLRLMHEEERVPVSRAALEKARHMAALRVDCGCGAPAGTDCQCSDVDRMASALANESPLYPAVCPTCRGTGGGNFNDCPTCDGNGEI